MSHFTVGVADTAKTVAFYQGSSARESRPIKARHRRTASDQASTS
jgi:hypothetical protein